MSALWLVSLSLLVYPVEIVTLIVEPSLVIPAGFLLHAGMLVTHMDTTG